jgi:hypothetical protein
VDTSAAREILKKVPTAVTYVPARAAGGLKRVRIDGREDWLG